MKVKIKLVTPKGEIIIVDGTCSQQGMVMGEYKKEGHIVSIAFNNNCHEHAEIVDGTNIFLATLSDMIAYGFASFAKNAGKPRPPQKRRPAPPHREKKR